MDSISTSYDNSGKIFFHKVTLILLVKKAVKMKFNHGIDADNLVWHTMKSLEEFPNHKVTLFSLMGYSLILFAEIYRVLRGHEKEAL